MPATRVLVCGSNYGRSYIHAMRLPPARYELAGILTRGSIRSKQTAENYRVPLWTKPEEVAGGIEIACAALNASAFEAVLRLLKRGVHVLCEHPQPSANLAAALATAERTGVMFHLNVHFGSLEAPREFIEQFKRLRAGTPPAFLQVMATERTLFGAVDILRRAMPQFEPFAFNPASPHEPFMAVAGRLAAIPAMFFVQTSPPSASRLPDGSGEYLVDMRITAGFPGAVLELCSIAGPVVCNKNYSRTTDRDASLWSVAAAGPAATVESLRAQRVRANRAALDALADGLQTGHRPAEQAPEHLLQVGRVWETISEALRD